MDHIKGHQAQVTSALRCKMILKLENMMWRLQLALPRACIPHGMAIKRCISNYALAFNAMMSCNRSRCLAFLLDNLSQSKGRLCAEQDLHWLAS